MSTYKIRHLTSLLALHTACLFAFPPSIARLGFSKVPREGIYGICDYYILVTKLQVSRYLGSTESPALNMLYEI